MFPSADPIADTRLWLERAVIGLNLCPFAKAVVVKDQVRFVLSDATTPEALLEELGDLVLARIPRVTDVLSVIVASLQRVVLDADQVVADVVEAGLTGCHDEPPSVWIGI